MRREVRPEPLAVETFRDRLAPLRVERAEELARERCPKGAELFWAAAGGCVGEVEAALKAKVDPNLLDYEARTALHVASAAGHASIVESLILKRAEVNPMDRWGRTPLDEAHRSCHDRAEAVLRSFGAAMRQEQVQRRAASRKWEICREDVRLGAELGSTIKSVVHRATWNGLEVAAKFCLPDEADPGAPRESEEELLREIEIMGHVRHPNLVMFLGCCLKDSPIMLVTEFMSGGDLERYYCKRARDGNGRWRAGYAQVTRWGQDIIRALDYLHQQHIVHRDLKPMNVLLSQDGKSVKVADFGISKVIKRKIATPDALFAARPVSPMPSMATTASVMSPTICGVAGRSSPAATGRSSPSVESVAISAPSSPQLCPLSPGSTFLPGTPLSPSAASAMSYKMTGGVGSWLYMAPEVARHEKYTEKVDIYSWGLTLYFLSSGYQPFRTYGDPVEVLRQYSLGSEPRPTVADCPSSLRGIMSDAWSASPKHRPSARELLERMEDVVGGSKCCGCPAQ